MDKINLYYKETIIAEDVNPAEMSEATGVQKFLLPESTPENEVIEKFAVSDVAAFKKYTSDMQAELLTAKETSEDKKAIEDNIEILNQVLIKLDDAIGAEAGAGANAGTPTPEEPKFDLYDYQDMKVGEITETEILKNDTRVYTAGTKDGKKIYIITPEFVYQVSIPSQRIVINDCMTEAEAFEELKAKAIVNVVNRNNSTLLFVQ